MHAQSPPSILANPNLRLLLGASAVSLLGDQFTLVALPWLVLTLTANPAALGLVFATIALPRALFMLLGGAVVDRLSPQRALLWARSVNAALIAILAVLVWVGAARMAVVYAIALGIGISTAFAYPAGSAILPQLVTGPQLPAANAILMGLRQLSMFVGPVLAGLVIVVGAQAGQGRGAADTHGLGLAFAIDAASFVVSLGLLFVLRVHSSDQRRRSSEGVLADVASGLRMIWSDLPLRAFMLYAAAVTVLVGGPVQVGLPLLANTRLDLGAASLGLLMTANGGGMLIGGILSQRVMQGVRGRLGVMVLGMDGVVGLAVVLLGWVHSTVDGVLVLAGAGVFGGIAQIAVISWIQQRVPQAMMGRVMSVVMFVFMGLGPVSAAVAGILLKVISLPTLFVGAGLALTTIAVACLAHPALRGIGMVQPEAA